jgi:hypothetical protein
MKIVAGPFSSENEKTSRGESESIYQLCPCPTTLKHDLEGKACGWAKRP